MRIVIPFTAGSQTDVLARMIGAKLAGATDHQVVADNRPGAGGIVAGGIVNSANPDGHTIMLSSLAYAVSAALYAKLPYDALQDIVGVGQVASTPLVLVVNPGIGVKSVKELIALAKQKPGALLFGSAGIVNLPELKKPMLAQGVVLKSSSAEEFHKLVAEDIGKLSKIVKAAGIKVD